MLGAIGFENLSLVLYQFYKLKQHLLKSSIALKVEYFKPLGLARGTVN